MVDALNAMIALDPPEPAVRLLKKMGIGENGKRLVLITAHRRENFGKPLEEICQAIKKLAEFYSSEIHFLYPVHLNPNVQEPVYAHLDGIANITLTDPLDYLTLIHIMKQAVAILTDSGGIQEETTALGIPTLVLREVTERPEGVAAGILHLVGTNEELIVEKTRNLLDKPDVFRSTGLVTNPFGDGHASERIVEALLGFDEPVRKIRPEHAICRRILPFQ